MFSFILCFIYKSVADHFDKDSDPILEPTPISDPDTISDPDPIS